MVLLLGFVSVAVFTAIEIPILRKKQFGQYIREEGPQSHMAKQGTPTMGGVAIYAGVALTALVCGAMNGADMGDMAIIVIAGFLFGLIGFLDDFIKVAAKHNLGLRAWQKLVLQVLFSAGLGCYVMFFTDEGTNVWIPFYGKDVDFGILYIPFVVFVMVAMANSVNLTDGLDGLCSTVTLVVSLFFAWACLQFGGDASSIYTLALAGACAGFLVFNHHPAKIFMGDTGSMALGAGLTAAVIVTRSEFLIPIAGFVYVMEAMSDIIQVLHYKRTGKRVFRMAPIHHHFELGGMSEVQVQGLFAAISAVCCVLAFLIIRI